jgi:hypothetical protein
MMKIFSRMLDLKIHFCYNLYTLKAVNLQYY